MNGRGDAYRIEPPRFFRGLFSLGHEIGAAFAAREQAEFTGLRQPISALVPGDPAIARDLYRGHFTFARKALDGQPGRMLSLCTDPLYTEEILSLSWLPHLAAADFSLYRGFSRNLYNLCAQIGVLPVSVRCRRLMVVSRHAAFLVADAPSDFADGFFRSVSKEARDLSFLRVRTVQEKLRQALALLAVALAFRGGEGLRAQALDSAAAAIPAVVLADGGHVTRNPKALLDLLLDLIPLVEALRAHRITAPAALGAAIERALPMLRMMCHGDGGLALFQGADNISAAAVAAALDCDAVEGRPLCHAPHSGYVRLNHGKSVVIMDAGHAVSSRSALAFEFSCGQNRIVTNCGVPEFASRAWRDAASSAAAHSGLQLENAGRRELPSFLRRYTRMSSANRPHVEVVDTPHGVVVKAMDPSYEASNGLIHHREIFLAASGHGLDGEDRFAVSTRLTASNDELRFTLRFHLDPAIKVFSGRNGAVIMLLLPNRDVWQFSARGGRAILEESVLLAGREGIRNSRQIVIRGASERPGPVHWNFRRIEKPSRQSGRDDDNPRFPF